ncbi:MAG: aldehyde dehydrogenase family protein [Bacteroidota bacterium]|jgi:aldehyde dehydrogenase (NAD+)
MTGAEIRQRFDAQQRFFASGATRSHEFRRSQLQQLERMITEHEADIVDALQADLGKSVIESYSSEIGFLLSEIRHVQKYLRRWMKPRRVKTMWMHAPASSRVLMEPYGIAAIFGTWNYPFQLMLSPLIGALSAGNCALLKPSEISGRSAALLERLVADYFDPRIVTVIPGGPDTAQLLLELPTNSIFFTGSARVGRLVMQAAAQQLIPCTLELGGKNPCIVDQDTDIRITARRIAFGKFFNAGQTCIAPDYLLVHEKIKAELLATLCEVLREFYGPDPASSTDYGRIVNERHFDRLVGLMNGGRLVHGGERDQATRFIAPTIIDEVSWDDPIMQEEIFGPLLPVLSYRSVDDAVAQMEHHPTPLALYCFSRNRRVTDEFIARVASGTVCINGALSHVASFTLPFGGVGSSGMGRYHGRHGFDTFSQSRGVLRRSLRFDYGKMYPPYEISVPFYKRILSLLFRQY